MAVSGISRAGCMSGRAICRPGFLRGADASSRGDRRISSISSDLLVTRSGVVYDPLSPPAGATGCGGSGRSSCHRSRAGPTEDFVILNETPLPGRSIRGRDVIRQIVSSYEDLLTRLYSMIRFTILRQPFLEEIGQYLPREGRILDLGSGFGLFSLYYAALEPGRRITGIDLSPNRVERARKSAGKLGLSNVEYDAANVLEWKPEEDFDAVYLLDVIHHLPAAEVPGFLEKIRSLIVPGGMLVIKEVADRPRYKMLFTLVLDRLMVGMEPIRYWPPDELMELLTRLGFRVFRHRMTDILPYPHILYIARLLPTEVAW